MGKSSTFATLFGRRTGRRGEGTKKRGAKIWRIEKKDIPLRPQTGTRGAGLTREAGGL